MELIDQLQRWRVVTDQVMGGESKGSMRLTTHNHRDCLTLDGHVSTANGGGFVQLSCDLSGIDTIVDGAVVGLKIVAAGHPEQFNLHLRTADLTRPWQSYRWQFTPAPEWQEWIVDFDQFVPHRTDHVFDRRRLTRVGIVALGREFDPVLFIHSLKLSEQRHV